MLTLSHEPSSKLSVPRIELFPRLGLGDEERAKPQKVTLSLTIVFAKVPPACDSDDISSTLCYHTLCDRFEELLANQEFKLIEHLANTLVSIVGLCINERGLGSARVLVELHKVSVPVPAIPDGVVFSLERFVA